MGQAQDLCVLSTCFHASVYELLDKQCRSPYLVRIALSAEELCAAPGCPGRKHDVCFSRFGCGVLAWDGRHAASNCHDDDQEENTSLRDSNLLSHGGEAFEVQVVGI